MYLVPGSHVTAIRRRQQHSCEDVLFLEGPARTPADFSSRFPTFIVRFQTVLALVFPDKGKSSPKISATKRYGYSVAISAVRYFNSGVVGFLFVKSVEPRRDSRRLQY